MIGELGCRISVNDKEPVEEPVEDADEDEDEDAVEEPNEDAVENEGSVWGEGYVDDDKGYVDDDEVFPSMIE
jgi:hypothetical protein